MNHSTERRTTQSSDWPRDLPLAARLAMFWAWLTLLGSLLMTAAVWYMSQQSIQRQAQQRFDTWVAAVDQAVLSRMQAQRQVLYGALGLLKASSKVTREEWQAYVAALELEKNYPGILGVGFVKNLTPSDLPGHLREIRAKGFPDYDVRPPGRRAEYMPIVYLEPFNWRNRRAFGFDMFTDPTRREAMETARDQGRATVSGKVTLVQETERDVQSGFLMYLPFYRPGAPVGTPEQRRSALAGYVFSPFRINDLMSGILGRNLTDVRLQIYDGVAVSAPNLMYDSQPQPNQERGSSRVAPPAFSRTHTLDIEGHPWTLVVSSLPAFEGSISYQKPRLILQAGTLISLLMFVVVWSLASLRRRALLMAEDITAALRESREQFQAVAETANDAIVSIDSRSRITYFNHSAEQLFGYSYRSVLGQPFTMLLPEPYGTSLQDGLQRFLATGESVIVGKTTELVGRHQDGSEFPIEISVAQWATAEGIFLTAMVRDIGERIEAEKKIHQLNRELQHQVEQLAAVNEELESFSYSVSHDLRAPLRAINGFGHMLREDYGTALDQEGQRLLHIILESSRKMGLLIDDLLAFARLGQTPVARTRVDMSRLVQEAVDEICQTGDCRPENFIIGSLPPTQGDRALLRQVWANLMTNAVKFSHNREQPRIEAGCLAEGEELRYFVRDNGVGFDMAYASQLFGVFKRLHRSEDFPGTGVGLAIVHRIVTKHGGRVWAEGRVNEGATFYFALPRAEGQD